MKFNQFKYSQLMFLKNIKSTFTILENLSLQNKKKNLKKSKKILLNLENGRSIIFSQTTTYQHN